MGVETNIVLGYGVIAALFAYFGFEFMSMPVPMGADGNPVDGMVTHLGRLFFFLSVIFIMVLTYTLMLIGQANGLTYINSSVLEPVATVIIYVFGAALCIYILIIITQICIYLYTITEKASGARKKGGPGQ